MVYESQLYHHGIKHQKWGVRHGPPYPLAEDAKILAKEGQKATENAANKKAKKEASTKASSMTDQELQDAVKRMNLEKQYTDLSTRDTKSGVDYANKTFGHIVTGITAAASAASLMWTIKQIRNNRGSN